MKLLANLETLFLLVLGILLQMADGSPFSLKERWLLVWDTELPSEFFSAIVQKLIKTLLSAIVVIRCATTYAYVVSAMLVLFSIIKDSSPKLMLLWLLVAMVKSICMTFLEALTGVYVCSAFGNIRKACIEFFISKALELIFACYLWANVLNIYQEMERKAERSKDVQTKEKSFLQKVNFGRQRARSLVDESTLRKTACLNNFEYRDVPHIILQMLLKDGEMSEDSLLDPGMMLASVSNLGSCESLKISQSLGELGFVDLETTEVIGLDDDESLSYQEKAMKFLKLTRSDVQKIKLNKTTIENDIYAVDKDTWTRVVATGAHINKPKHCRTQIFIQNLPQTDAGEENLKNFSETPKKAGNYTMVFSLSEMFTDAPPPYNETQDEDYFTPSEEDEDNDDYDQEASPLFMSNLKEGTSIRQGGWGLVFNKLKKHAYAELLKQDFMNTIGPEVFDRAPKLLRVTSATSFNKNTKPRTSVSLPALPDAKKTERRESFYEDESNEKINYTLSLDTHSELSNVEKNIFGGTTGSDEDLRKKDSSEKESLTSCYPVQERTQPENESVSGSEKQDSCSEDSERSKTHDEPSLPSCNVSATEVDSSHADTKSKPCFRKRRIILRRVGRRKSTWFFSSPSDSDQPSKKPDSYRKCSSEPKQEKPENRNGFKGFEKVHKAEPSKSVKNHHPCYKPRSEQVYFLTDLFQKSFVDVLMIYYDLKKKARVENAGSTLKMLKKESSTFLLRPGQLKRYENVFHSLEFKPKEAKVWKSKVLKTAEFINKRNHSGISKRFQNIVKRESILKILLNYEWSRLKSVNRTSISPFDAKFSDWLSKAINKTENDVMRYSDDSVLSKPESQVSTDVDLAVLEKETVTDLEREDNIRDSSWSTQDAEDYDFIKTDADESTVEDDSEPSNTQSESMKENTVPQDSRKNPEGESFYSQESDEPISLYYSKAANLASPLFDMKRFIYPDHIHYSYKHVKKKGFDVDINGGLPLLVRESLTMGNPVQMGNKLFLANPEFEIKRRPMDLSFAATNAFAEWQTNDQNDTDTETSEDRVGNNTFSSRKDRKSFVAESVSKIKKPKKTKRPKKNSLKSESRSSVKSKPKEGNFSRVKHLDSANDNFQIENWLKSLKRINSNEKENNKGERKPTQISSTQLHSNKGRINSTYNPAIFLQENKTRIEKRKKETQEERTKDMFARLEREALLHSKNVHKSIAPNRS